VNTRMYILPTITTLEILIRQVLDNSNLSTVTE